jgi:hypothetical protein
MIWNPRGRWCEVVWPRGCVVWAIVSVCREIVVRGYWKTFMRYAATACACVLFGTALTWLASGRDWSIVMASFRSDKNVEATAAAPVSPPQLDWAMAGKSDIEKLSDQHLGAVRNAVGIRVGEFSGNMKLSFQAVRSIG